MNSLKILSFSGLLLYFAMLLLVVMREKKNQNVLDYFFAGRQLPFWALSITFIASWWGAGSALSTADLAYNDGIGAFWYYGIPVLIATFLLILFSKIIRSKSFLTQGMMMRARYNGLVSKVLAVMIFLFMTISAASQMVGIGDFQSATQVWVGISLSTFSYIFVSLLSRPEYEKADAFMAHSVDDETTLMHTK